MNITTKHSRSINLRTTIFSHTKGARGWPTIDTGCPKVECIAVKTKIFKFY